ncbi:MAG: heavy metal-binding domain-containing protein [Cyclobacteriaceae bacterium]
MKKSILSFAFSLAIVVACSFIVSCSGQKSEAAQEETVAEAAYACPMHPEVTGKENDTCSKCGMALEKVEEQEGHEHMQH